MLLLPVANESEHGRWAGAMMLLVALFPASHATSAAAGDSAVQDRPTAAAHAIGKGDAPKIDGRLDEPAWAR